MKTKAKTLNPELLRKIYAYWRAAEYLSVGQIYLYDNPLLQKPLTLAHIKPPARSLGHDAGTELHLRPTETACGPVGASSNDTAASAHVLDCPVVGAGRNAPKGSVANRKCDLEVGGWVMLKPCTDSEQAFNEADLANDVAFGQPFHLSFANHVHGLVSRDRSDRPVGGSEP